MTLEKEIVSTAYAIKVDLKKIEDKDFEHENEGDYDNTLNHILYNMKGLYDIDYNAHFGSYVWLTIYKENDNDDTWKYIEKIITEYLK